MGYIKVECVLVQFLLVGLFRPLLLTFAVSFLSILSDCFSICKPAWDNSAKRAVWEFVTVDGFPLCKKKMVSALGCVYIRDSNQS